MKTSTLLLCLLLTLPLIGCRGTTRADRMPVSANTIANVMTDANRELRATRRKHTALELPADDAAELERMANEIGLDLQKAHAMLQEARRSVDVEKLELSGNMTLRAFDRIQELQDAGILAQHAALSER